MGHYYSEMVSDEELNAKAERKQRRIEITKKNLIEAMERDGVAGVLAKIICEAAEHGIYIGCDYRR